MHGDFDADISVHAQTTVISLEGDPHANMEERKSETVTEVLESSGAGSG